MDMSMFQREQGYRLCLSLLEPLREKGLLTAEEFVQARAVLIEKYDPPIERRKFRDYLQLEVARSAKIPAYTQSL